MPHGWVDPAEYIEHKGVSIYHLYDDDWADNPALVYHFTTNPLGSSEDYTGKETGNFDVRDLPYWKTACKNQVQEQSRIKTTIIKAIEAEYFRGWLGTETPNGK